MSVAVSERKPRGQPLARGPTDLRAARLESPGEGGDNAGPRPIPEARRTTQPALLRSASNTGAFLSSTPMTGDGSSDANPRQQ